MQATMTKRKGRKESRKGSLRKTREWWQSVPERAKRYLKMPATTTTTKKKAPPPRMVTMATPKKEKVRQPGGARVARREGPRGPAEVHGEPPQARAGGEQGHEAVRREVVQGARGAVLSRGVED